MAKDDKGGSDKDKKAAVKGLQDIRGGIDDLRDLHEKLGKQLAEYDKSAASLQAALAKDNEAEQKKRFEIMQATQDKVFGIMQDVTKNKSTTAEKAAKAIDAYIRS